MRGFWKWGLTVVGLAVIAIAGGLVSAQPAMGMYVCAGCYGFEAHGSHLYFDKAMDAPTATRLKTSLAEGRARVEAFYGSVQSDPRIFVCGSEACDKRMRHRGGAKARAYGASFIFFYSQWTGPDFFAHELSHIELHHRIGLRRMVSGAVPAWFDEGVASVISRDPRYVKQGPDGALACVAQPDGPLPTGRSDWSRAAGDPDRPIYAMAACAVLHWMDRHDGRDGVLAALADVADGKDMPLP